MLVYFEGRIKPVLMFAHDKDIRGNSHVSLLKPFSPYSS